MASRNPALLARDAAAEARGAENPHGSETGIMLYVDLFSGSLAALEEKIPYLQQLGITYVHLMPLFRTPEGDNDGGYAVSSYREVNPALGTITDLARIAERFHDAGMRLVLDFVFNHTSDEHEWALAAKRGEEKYKDYYRIFPDKTEAEEWNRTLREIFPDTRRGSFTFVEAVQGWVWTTFNSFQWDLNYANPEVFLSMCSEMLALSNLGVDVLRLDALAFVWKEKGTNCENLPLAHSLIQAFRYVSMIAAPSLEFKSEAIVHPDEVIRYIAVNECTLSYNPLQMALFWEAVATRKTTLLGYSLRKRWSTPPSCSWVNYIRCHDDIGWTFSDEDARDCGINGFHHRQFLNKFYTGRFEGAFARGEPFQLNPETGDCRVCGTMASLAGLEQALEVYSAGLEANDPAQLNHAELLASMAVRRIGMMCTVLISLPGIPLLYANDEIGVLNDYRYRSDPAKKDDSRWVHR
ncbi:MAG TPA: alpha-amylase family protein, partial [Treponemataceae bacterium]|nr:alpha-amylase family protein [Treponemataceae bacterium]